MALSASSVLHYWTARYGSVPVIGGKPTHARSSAGRWVDQQGTVQSAIVNTPRFNWPTIDSEKRQAMRLELARTNLWQFSQDFSNAGAGWALSNLTQTANAAIAPDGTLTAAKILASAGATNNNRAIGAIGSNLLTFSCFVKPITLGITLSFGIFDNTTSSNVVFGDFNTTTGAFTLSLSSVGGATVAVEAVGGGWYRVSVSAPTTSGHSFSIYAGWTGGVSAAGDAAYFWGAQVEASATVSSYIPTSGSTVTRAADTLYWDYTPIPQALISYVRFVERGTTTLNGCGVWRTGDLIGNNPYLVVYNSSGAYRFYQNGVFSGLPNAPNYGDVCEIVGVLFANGSVRCIQSVNGAAVTAGATSGVSALPSAWTASRLWLNDNGGGSQGMGDFAELKHVKYADVVAVTDQGIMDELRAFELGPNGAVL